MTNHANAPIPFPDTTPAIGLEAALEKVGARRGTNVVAGVIVAVDPAADGARMATAILRDSDGVEHVVRLPRELVPTR